MLRIGQTIKKWRGSHGLSQSQLAARLGVSFRSVVYWEAGQRVPRQKLVIDRLEEVIPELREHPDLRGKKEVATRNLEMKSSPSLPDNFPVEIGINFYNKDFESCIDEYFSLVKIQWPEKKLGEYKERLVNSLKDSYTGLVIKEIMDRAIEKDPPRTSDEDFLKQGFNAQAYFSWGRDLKREIWKPKVSLSLSLLSLLVNWIFYVWRGEIKIGRCKAKDCPRIFDPKRSDQVYCSTRCRDREVKRRYRQRKKKREMSTK